MGCGCNKKSTAPAVTAAGAATPQARYRLTLPAGTSFPDSNTPSKTFVRRQDAIAANQAVGGIGTIEPVEPTRV